MVRMLLLLRLLLQLGARSRWALQPHGLMAALSFSSAAARLGHCGS